MRIIIKNCCRRLHIRKIEGEYQLKFYKHRKDEEGMKKKGKWLLSMALMVSLAVPVSAAPVNLQDVSAVEASADTAGMNSRQKRGCRRLKNLQSAQR